MSEYSQTVSLPAGGWSVRPGQVISVDEHGHARPWEGHSDEEAIGIAVAHDPEQDTVVVQTAGRAVTEAVSAGRFPFVGSGANTTSARDWVDLGEHVVTVAVPSPEPELEPLPEGGWVVRNPPDLTPENPAMRDWSSARPYTEPMRVPDRDRGPTINISIDATDYADALRQLAERADRLAGQVRERDRPAPALPPVRGRQERRRTFVDEDD